MALGAVVGMGLTSLLSDIASAPERRRVQRLYREAYERARKANLQRYAQIMRGYEGLRTEARRRLTRVGRREREDIETRYTTLGREAEQRLAARGMGGTTVMPRLREGIERERGSALERLESGLTQQRLGYETQITGGMLGAMERREDVYPDPAQAAMMYGATGMPATESFLTNLPAMMLAGGYGRGRREQWGRRRGLEGPLWDLPPVPASYGG